MYVCKKERLIITRYKTLIFICIVECEDDGCAQLRSESEPTRREQLASTQGQRRFRGKNYLFEFLINMINK